MQNLDVLDWLLADDVAIQYQVHRDLLSTLRKDLLNRISKEGFGARFLAKRHKGPLGTSLLSTEVDF